jgi:hypothetical protein
MRFFPAARYLILVAFLASPKADRNPLLIFT